MKLSNTTRPRNADKCTTLPAGSSSAKFGTGLITDRLGVTERKGSCVPPDALCSSWAIAGHTVTPMPKHIDKSSTQTMRQHLPSPLHVVLPPCMPGVQHPVGIHFGGRP